MAPPVSNETDVEDFFASIAIESPQGNFFMVWIALMWIFSFPIVILFWKHSREHPIAGRHPRLMLVATLLFLVFVTVVNLERAYPQIYQCEAFIVVTIVVFGMSLWTMFLRVWAVFFMFMTTHERARPKQLPEAKKEGWFISHRWLAGQLVLQISFVLGFFVLVGVAIIIGFLSRADTDTGVDSCQGRNAVFIFMGVEVLLVGSIFSVFALLLRNTANDSLFIKKELTVIAIVCFVAVVCFLPLSLIESMREFSRETFSLPALICSLTGALVVIVCLMYPLSKLHIGDGEDTEQLTLFECLDHVEGRESFREFLITEFSVENILVLDDIGFYKELVKTTQAKHSGSPKNKGDGTHSMLGGLGLQSRDNTKPEEKAVALDVFKGGGEDGEKILSAARALYKRYIVPGAPDQVNLPSATVNQVQQEMMVTEGSEAVWNGTVFDVVKDDIESLCRRDSFPRYCRSPLGKAFKDKMGKQQQQERRKGLVIHFCKLLGLCCAACCAGIISLCAAF